MKTFTARQPIFNRKKYIVAYEILYRKDENNFFPTDVSGEKATCSLILNSFLDTDILQLSNNKPLLINFSSVELLKNLLDIMPCKKVYIEILETLEPSYELLTLIKRMYNRGYNFVLDDFIYSEEWDKFFPYIKIIKFDIRLTPLNTLKPIIHKLKKFKIKLLAEKVETYEEFDEAYKMNFDFFQGFFFSKPEMVEHSSNPYQSATFLLLYKELLKTYLNYERISQLIEMDVSIAYKFLRYVNELSKVKRKKEITSIKDAAIYIGENFTKNFIFLIISAELTTNKPLELQRVSVLRSKFLELIAKHSYLRKYYEEAALIGLFSSLDAILDKKMEDILNDLSIDCNIKEALINKTGKFAIFIHIFENYEKGNWDYITNIAKEIGIQEDKIHDKYLLAVRWTDKNFEK